MNGMRNAVDEMFETLCEIWGTADLPIVIGDELEVSPYESAFLEIESMGAE